MWKRSQHSSVTDIDRRIIVVAERLLQNGYVPPKLLLKQKLQELNQLAVAAVQNVIYNSPTPVIKVETQEEGFTIKVVCEKSCQGLLTFILEAFEKLGLDVLQARASCV
ncbi:hypothetical protein V8G54_007714 [Vigna mungo]|uniref:Plant bHLH transcription factor ACT-like domain-containing protein n=1 Tax=Vigna mungo TaxID=3915 RepID=A0AAQ3P4F8_VIGMU